MRLPRRCPACSSNLEVTHLVCPGCSSQLEGRFTPCRFCSLDESEQDLLARFVLARGNKKALEREFGVSYATVRSRVDRLRIRLLESGPVPGSSDSAMGVLADLRAGRIDAAEAARRLRRGGGR